MSSIWWKTSEYQLAGDVLTMNAAGQSEISYADFAVAVLDLIESGGASARARKRSVAVACAPAAGRKKSLDMNKAGFPTLYSHQGSF